MGRYTGPKAKLMRREGQELFLKGSKTFTEKNPLKRKPQAPGQHGLSRKRLSDFGLQLREKQKVKRMYGVLERQFRKYYEDSIKFKGVTGDILLGFLERRLDNVIYRAGLSATRAQARSWIRQKKVFVNSKVVDIPSFIVTEKNIITFKDGFAVAVSEEYVAPQWIKFDKKKSEITFSSLPKREDVTEIINEQLIIDSYSR